MDYYERKQFRKSRKWKEFKAKMRLNHSVDAITKEFLVKAWNLHHLDLNKDRYNDLSDVSKFMCLNPKTHEIIHELYKWYRRDKKVLQRIQDTLNKMEEYTSEKFNSKDVL